MKRKTIAIDIDDVLAMSAAGFAAYSNERWASNMTTHDYQEEWAKAWGVPVDEAMRRAEELLASGIFGQFDPFADALPIVTALAGQYNVIIVTSRRMRLKEETEAWLARYFPGIFSEVHYVGIWDDANAGNVLERAKLTKADLCAQIGADYLIDDQVKHCLASAAVGVKTLLFGYYGWNRDLVDMPPGMVRVKDWHAVKEYFDEQS